MVTPSKSLIQQSLFDSVNDWLQRMCDSVSVAAGEAYAAGEFHAVGQLRAGVSFDVVQKDALEYAKTYRQNLVEHGEIQVSKIQYGSDGKPLLNKNGTIMRRDETVKWLTGSNQKISNDIAEIIQRGISEGKATGVRQLASGGYPAGSIAEELNQYLSGYKSRASTIARTETARNYYHGEQNRYAKAGVRYVQYLAAPDACEECLPYAGEVFELGTEPPLPIHPNCRCDYRPLSPNDAAYPEDAAGEDNEITVPEGWEEIGVEPEVSTSSGAGNMADILDIKTIADISDKPVYSPAQTISLSSVTTKQELSAALSEKWGTEITFEDKIFDNKKFLENMKSQFEHAHAVVADFKMKKIVCGSVVDYKVATKMRGTNVYAAAVLNSDKYTSSQLAYGGVLKSNKSIDDITNAYLSDLSAGYHPKGTSGLDVYVHELGHCVMNRIYSMGSSYVRAGKLYTPDMNTYLNYKRHTASKIILNAQKELTKKTGTETSLPVLRADLSGYAIEKDQECLAEAFTDYYVNGEKAKPFSKEIIYQVKNIYKEVKESFENGLVQNAKLEGKESSLKIMNELGWW